MLTCAPVRARIYTRLRVRKVTAKFAQVLPHCHLSCQNVHVQPVASDLSYRGLIMRIVCQGDLTFFRSD